MTHTYMHIESYSKLWKKSPKFLNIYRNSVEVVSDFKLILCCRERLDRGSLRSFGSHIVHFLSYLLR